MNQSVDVAHISRLGERHMAVGTLLRFRWIVKGTRALAGDSARLPVVVFVEAAEPAIVIYRKIQMNLMATGAELSRLCSHERFQKHPAVGFWIQLDQKVVQFARKRIFGRS